MVLNPKLNFKQAILSTFSFFDMFDYPLSQEEVEEYLYKLPLDEHQIDLYLKNSAALSYSDGLYCLKGNEEAFFKMDERRKMAKRYWEKIRKFRKIFNIIPFIRLVAVANNLAYDNPTKRSDIDLVIITKPGYMFIARTCLTISTHLFRMRRHGSKIRGRFCLSFYITEDNLDLEKIAIENDIYLAYWLKTLQPVCGDYQTYIDLMDHNRKFLERFFATPLNYQKRHYRANRGWVRKIRRFRERILRGKFGKWLEGKLRSWQMKRMQAKLEKMSKNEGKEANIIISDKILKFHNIDRREYYKKRWIKKVKEVI